MSNFSSWEEWANQNPDRVRDQTVSSGDAPAAGGASPLTDQVDRPKEAAIQRDVVRWARRHQQVYPALGLLHSTPNEGFADLHKKTAKDRKRMGVRAGVPDLHLPVPSGPWPALWVELKRPGEDLSPVQYRRLRELDEYGNAVDVAWTVGQAIFVLTHYLDHPETFLSGY